MKILAIICARGGSKGVPRKNIKKLLGTPLISYTINIALKCKLIDKLVVSTDDEEIAKIAKECGAEVPYIRPKYLAKDTTPTFPVVVHMLKYLKYQNYLPDIVVLLDATSPLKKVEDIVRCINTVKSKSDAAITVCETRQNPYFTQLEYEGDYLSLSKKMDKIPTRRQDAPSVYFINGSVWAIKTNVLLEEKTFCPKKTLPVIVPEERSLQVDTPFDFKILEIVMGKNENIRI